MGQPHYGARSQGSEQKGQKKARLTRQRNATRIKNTEELGPPPRYPLEGPGARYMPPTGLGLVSCHGNIHLSLRKCGGQGIWGGGIEGVLEKVSFQGSLSWDVGPGLVLVKNSRPRQAVTVELVGKKESKI